MADEKELENPIFEDVVIFYNYVFDLGKPITPIEVGRKILQTEYAISLSNYTNDKVELASKFNENLALRNHAIEVTKFLGYAENKNYRSALLWLARNPKYTSRFLLIFWNSFQRQNNHEEGNEGTSDLNEDTAGEAPPTSLEDAIDDLDKRMGQLQSLTALQMLSDRTLFSDIYLSEFPFVRLELQPVFAFINSEKNEFKVSLFIHRTGIAILSFYTKFDKKLRSGELIDLQVLQDVKIKKVEIPDALMAIQAIVYGAKPSSIRKALDSQRKTTHQGWFEFFAFEAQDDAKYSLRDIMEWYRITILSTVTGKFPDNIENFWKLFRSTDWFAYPIVFVREMPQECAKDDEFKNQYAAALAGIITRYKEWRKLKPAIIETQVKKDFSISQDKSQYLTSGNALVLYYPSFNIPLNKKYDHNIPSYEWLFSHFHTSGLIDILLTQSWMLHIINAQLKALPSNLRKLNILKRNLLMVISEYHDINVSYGTAKDIINACQSEFGLDITYSGLKDKLSNLEKIIDTEENLKRYKRDLTLRLVVIFITLLFGVSGAAQVVSVISKWPLLSLTTTPTWLKSIIAPLQDFIQFHPTCSTLILYGLLLILIIPIMAWSIWPSRRKMPIVIYDHSEPANRPNFTWPNPVRFIYDPDQRERAKEKERSPDEASKIESKNNIN